MAYFDASYTGNRLLMLGLIHRDREGEHLLYDWLETTRPGAITLEFSRYGHDFRVRNGDALRATVRQAADQLVAEGREVNDKALAALLSYIDLPAEFLAASAYAARHGVPLSLIDMDRYSASKLADMPDLLGKQNLETLLTHAPSRDGRYEKALARLFFEKGVRPFPYTEEMRVRDTYMRDEIARVMKRHGEGRLLHLCGWQHLCDPFHIYRELNPTKVFIYDKAFCI